MLAIPGTAWIQTGLEAALVHGVRQICWSEQVKIDGEVMKSPVVACPYHCKMLNEKCSFMSFYFAR